MTRWAQLFVLSGLLTSGSNVFAFLPAAKPFIEKHCAECHDAEAKKGGLDLTSLNYSPEDKLNFGTWVKVHDRVEAGEIPPKKKPRPEAATLGAFLKGLGSELTASEKGVVFALAHQPKQSKAAGRVMFFPHLATNHKGILCAMATEQIPVQATFPKAASSVSLALWGSTGCAALLEAFDKSGTLVDKASAAVVPGRTKPEDPIPMFELKVKAREIAYIRFSGPRTGEFLAADEVRFIAKSDSTD